MWVAAWHEISGMAPAVHRFFRANDSRSAFFSKQSCGAYIFFIFSLSNLVKSWYLVANLIKICVEISFKTDSCSTLFKGCGHIGSKLETWATSTYTHQPIQRHSEDSETHRRTRVVIATRRLLPVFEIRHSNIHIPAKLSKILPHSKPFRNLRNVPPSRPP